MTDRPDVLRAARELDAALALRHHEAVPVLRHRLDLAVARALDDASAPDRRALLAAWRRATRVLDGDASPARRPCPWRARHGRHAA